jgi:hypothetical protein
VTAMPSKSSNPRPFPTVHVARAVPLRTTARGEVMGTLLTRIEVAAGVETRCPPRAPVPTEGIEP